MPLESIFLYDLDTVENEQQDENAPVKTLSDAALVARAQRGDVAAFEELVRKYRNEVFALSYHFVRNREEAWDIAQEAFVKAYRAIKKFRGDAGFKTWVMRIAANHAKDFLKKKRLETVPFNEVVEATSETGVPGPDKQLENNELGEAIEKALASLPVKHRQAFLLREYDGLSYTEMAEVMGCSAGTVMSRLHHARKKLQQALVRMGIRDGA